VPVMAIRTGALASRARSIAAVVSMPSAPLSQNRRRRDRRSPGHCHARACTLGEQLHHMNTACSETCRSASPFRNGRQWVRLREECCCVPVRSFLDSHGFCVSLRGLIQLRAFFGLVQQCRRRPRRFLSTDAGAPAALRDIAAFCGWIFRTRRAHRLSGRVQSDHRRQALAGDPMRRGPRPRSFDLCGDGPIGCRHSAPCGRRRAARSPRPRLACAAGAKIQSGDPRMRSCEARMMLRAVVMTDVEVLFRSPCYFCARFDRGEQYVASN